MGWESQENFKRYRSFCSARQKSTEIMHRKRELKAALP
jgi:hypothetical protein